MNAGPSRYLSRSPKKASPGKKRKEAVSTSQKDEEELSLTEPESDDVVSDMPSPHTRKLKGLGVGTRVPW